VSPGHAWARIDPGGQVWVGLDDFARKALKSIERVELPAVGTRVKRGDPLFTVRRGAESAKFLAPVSGEVTQVNDALGRSPGLAIQSPYDRGWVCLVRPADLANDLSGLRIGRPVVAWYQAEVEGMRKALQAAARADVKWDDFEARFLGPGVAVNEPVTDTVSAG
jgi:glycine cleavage system H protein